MTRPIAEQYDAIAEGLRRIEAEKGVRLRGDAPKDPGVIKSGLTAGLGLMAATLLGGKPSP